MTRMLKAALLASALSCASVGAIATSTATAPCSILPDTTVLQRTAENPCRNRNGLCCRTIEGRNVCRCCDDW